MLLQILRTDGKRMRRTFLGSSDSIALYANMSGGTGLDNSLLVKMQQQINQDLT